MKNRRKTGVLLVAMIAATFAVAAFAQAASAANPIKTLLSGKCLETTPSPITGVYSPGGDGGIFTQECRTTNQSPQLWQMTSEGTATVRGRTGTWNVYRFHNAASTGCLTNSGRLTLSAPIHTSNCAPTSSGAINKSELWTISRSGLNGSAELVNAFSGMCLDVHGGFPGPGVPMEQFTCVPEAPFEGNLFFF